MPVPALYSASTLPHLALISWLYTSLYSTAQEPFHFPFTCYNTSHSLTSTPADKIYLLDTRSMCCHAGLMLRQRIVLAESLYFLPLFDTLPFTQRFLCWLRRCLRWLFVSPQPLLTLHLNSTRLLYSPDKDGCALFCEVREKHCCILSLCCSCIRKSNCDIIRVPRFCDRHNLTHPAIGSTPSIQRYHSPSSLNASLPATNICAPSPLFITTLGVCKQ